MAGVACLDPGKGLASTTESYARSKAYPTSATPNPPRQEYDGLTTPLALIEHHSRHVGLLRRGRFGFRLRVEFGESFANGLQRLGKRVALGRELAAGVVSAIIGRPNSTLQTASC
jgi:hypothetical protein